MKWLFYTPALCFFTGSILQPTYGMERDGLQSGKMIQYKILRAYPAVSSEAAKHHQTEREMFGEIIELAEEKTVTESYPRPLCRSEAAAIHGNNMRVLRKAKENCKKILK